MIMKKHKKLQSHQLINFHFPSKINLYIYPYEIIDISYNFGNEFNRAFPTYSNIHSGKLKLEMKLLHIVDKKPKNIIKL